MQLYDLLQCYRPKLGYKVIKWMAPEEDLYKCNTDGACKCNPGLSAYGFCIRNSVGDLVYVEVRNVGESNSLIAEAIAIRKALEFCRTQALHNIILETDLLSLQKIIIKEWKVPWEIVQWVEDVWHYTESSNIRIMHTYREANYLADHIANIGITIQDKHQVWTFQSLPSLARRILNADKHQIPSLRITTISRHKNYRANASN